MATRKRPVPPKPDVEPEPTPKDKSGNIEVFAPRLLLHILGIERAPAAEVAQWEQSFARAVRSGFAALSGKGSFNHQQMLRAVDLWKTNDPSWWQTYLRWQCGEAKPPEEHDLLRFFGGSEPFSSTYEPFRWGAVLAARLWALKNRNDGLLRLTSRYAEVVCALCALTAVPWPDTVRSVNRRGQPVYRGPFVSPVGERSNEHIVSDLGPLFGFSVHWPDIWVKNPDTWPLRVALKLNGDLGVSDQVAGDMKSYVNGDMGKAGALERVLRGVTVRAENRVLRFPEGRLVYKTERTNGNTPCIFYEWYDFEAKTATVGFPWPSGRGARLRGAGQCEVVEDGEGRRIVAETEYGTATFSLPAGRFTRAAIGQEGLRREA